MKSRIALVVVGALALAVGLFLNRPAYGKGVSVVTPTTFDIAVSPGKELTTEIVLRQDVHSLTPLTLTVSPSLASYVSSIEPSELPPLPPSFAPGSTTTIALVFTVATGTPAADIKGNLLIGGKVLLPMQLSIGELFYPPDPGDPGKETLEGIDSDEDGVRDDIQRYIEMTYPDQPQVRVALRQYVVPLQASLRDAQSKEATIANRDMVERARGCIRSRLSSGESRLSMRSLIAEMLNTRDRSLAYITYNHQLGGQVFEGAAIEDPSACKGSAVREGFVNE